jgi:hypothetical protein
MPQIQIVIDKLDAQVLLPMILEQSRDRVGTAGGAYWLGLHSAINAALQRGPSDIGASLERGE